MSTTKPKLLTADDLLRLYAEGVNGELIRGVLSETMPPGRKHGRIQARLMSSLVVFVEASNLGFVVGETGVRLEQDPDTVRAPDIAYFSNERVPLGEREADDGYSEIAPDLAIEVVSPNDTRRAVHDKALDVAPEWSAPSVGGVSRHPHRRRTRRGPSGDDPYRRRCRGRIGRAAGFHLSCERDIR